MRLLSKLRFQTKIGLGIFLIVAAVALMTAIPVSRMASRAILSESLRGVICQQLLKTADGKGRVAALEIMVGTPAIGNLIREAKTFQIPSIMQTARKDGMQLMDQHILDLLKSKKVSPEEAYRFCADKKQFEQYLPTA